MAKKKYDTDKMLEDITDVYKSIDQDKFPNLYFHPNETCGVKGSEQSSTSGLIPESEIAYISLVNSRYPKIMLVIDLDAAIPHHKDEKDSEAAILASLPYTFCDEFDFERQTKAKCSILKDLSSLMKEHNLIAKRRKFYKPSQYDCVIVDFEPDKNKYLL